MTSDDDKLDETLEETFPASDAPANTTETGIVTGPPLQADATIADNTTQHRFELTVEMTRRLMKPRISLLTLGVDDLERSLTFYRDGLGLATAGIVGREFEHGAVVFIELEGGLGLALWSRANLAHDTGLQIAGRDATTFAIGHNVRTREEVDDVMAQAQRAGATIVKPAGNTFWGGYAGYFRDPDGHVWEIAWNPNRLPA